MDRYKTINYKYNCNYYYELMGNRLVMAIND